MARKVGRRMGDRVRFETPVALAALKRTSGTQVSSPNFSTCCE
jgi:hypothetical protein